MREMRGALSQSEFGKRIDQPQNVISRYEDPNYGKWTLSTLLDIAAKLDRALIVRFVDYQTFLKLTDDQSDIAAAPEAYDQQLVDDYAWAIAQAQIAPSTSDIYFPPPSSAIEVTINMPEIESVDAFIPVAGSETTPLRLN